MLISMNDGQKISRIIIISIVSFSLSLVFFISGILDIFELKAYDLLSRVLNPVSSAGDIVIIKIDQQSIDALSRNGIVWPWPRQMYAPIIEYASEADAIFMDLLFTEFSSYGQQDDLILSGAIKKASNVYLTVFLTNTKKTLSTEDREFIKNISIKNAIPRGLSFSSAVTPIDVLRDAAKGAGAVTIPPDKDGVYRRVSLIFGAEKYAVPHFILSYLIQKGYASVKNNSIYAKGTEIPLQGGNLMLRFYRSENPFPVISAAEIINAYNTTMSSKEPSIKKEYFKGKKVFIGLTAAGLYDLRPTSTSPVSTGVSIHAATLDNILNKNFIIHVSNAYLIAFLILICSFTSYFILRHHSLYLTLPILFLSLLVTLSAPALLFKNAFYMAILPPSASLIISFIVASSYSYAIEGKERRFVKRAFAQYMDENIVEYVLKNPHLIKPGGQRRRVTVFFSDIEGFTSIAEKVLPEETAKILHTVLNSFTEVIIRNKGIIDKYIGDGIMAFWGAPVDSKQDEINACRAALQCIEALDDINRKFRAEGLAEISVRIGINSGNAVAGNLGSDRLFDYTVVGDTVNLASRLESACKLFRTKIIISEETMQNTGNIFLERELGMIEVKGRSVPVRIFELVAESDKAGNNIKRAVELFHKGLSLFNDKKFTEADAVFNMVLMENPHDKTSEFYRQRCEQIIKNQHLTDDFNIIKITEK